MKVTDDDSELSISKPKFTVIREIYEKDYNTSEFLEEQLERALESKVQHIIIEPVSIGDETTKWIQVGNFLHKTSVLTGISFLITPLVFSVRLQPYVLIPLSSVNILCTTLYDLSWQFDPCCKYQIELNARKIEQLQSQTLSSATPLILVYKDDKYRKRLHNILSCCILATISWKLYRIFYKL
ncbi:transmembrane protein 11, mitochondrial [Hydra vulgaris]|uniref:Transmembrane protein 11, mitochondrial n=2 Tax=Hydra vulgaris TaxID=6087 RepID=A0ABM4CEK7_HYDVU|nr:transmembrane protein 11, mitochondrial [Hydra vulgaris]